MKKAVSSRNTKRGGRFAWGAAALCSALGLSASAETAQAQSICGEVACPTTFAITEKPLQKVPTTFKFQARVSQAKIPLGDAKIQSVTVSLNRANGESLCTETLENVMIRDSVLNIDIGRGMSCQLDEMIANNNDLSFKVCIGGLENCLKPVALGTVPQAIKASFAVQAQEAYKSQIAAQSHFAHRITPDADLFLTNAISKGYYNFQTPSPSNTMAGTLVTSPQTYVGGYIQWTPVNAADNVLHVSSATTSGSARTLSDLANFFVHATNTNVMGTLATEKAFTVKTGGADITGGIVVRPTSGVSMTTLDVRGNEVVAGSVTVSPPSGTGLAVTAGGATVAGGLTVSSAGLSVTGATTLNGPNTLNGTTSITGSTISIGVAGGTTTFLGNVTLPTTGVSYTIPSNTVTTNNMKSTCTTDPATSFCVSSGMITDGAIGTVDLSSGSVTSAKLAANAVVGGTGGAIQDGTITSADLSATASITSAQLAGGIAASKLAGGITGSQIAVAGIGSRELDISHYVGTVGPTEPRTKIVYVARGTTTTLLNYNDNSETRGVCVLTGMRLATSTGFCYTRVETVQFVGNTTALSGVASNADCWFICF